MHKQLLAVRTAREVTPTTPLAGAPAEVTEDGIMFSFFSDFAILSDQDLTALKLETLEELSRNVNEEIRNAYGTAGSLYQAS